MTLCPKGDGDHEFPDEDEDGARCEEHGVTLLWHGPPITSDDVTPEPHRPRAGFCRPAVPSSAPRPALDQHPH